MADEVKLGKDSVGLRARKRSVNWRGSERLETRLSGEGANRRIGPWGRYLEDSGSLAAGEDCGQVWDLRGSNGQLILPQLSTRTKPE